MSTFLKFALSFGCVFTLAGLAGCSSTSGGTSPRQGGESPSTMAATAPTEKGLVTFIMEDNDQAHPRGFLALPPTGKGPGVLVLHAWWGLNDTTKAVCTRLAQEGFVAFAPDLYHGRVADNIADAEALRKTLDDNQAKAEIAEATRFLSERAEQSDRGLAVVGFSLGAYYALDLAAAEPEHIRSVVLFYGTGGRDHSNSKAAYLGHFAEQDEFEPQSGVDELENALRRAGRPVTFYQYSGTGHWFFEPDRSQAYNKEAASMAWERTLAFLKRSGGL